MLLYDLNAIAPQDTSVYAISRIITEHCPVPRCETCKHWAHEKGPFGHCCLLVHGNYARELGVSRLAVADMDGGDTVPEFITRNKFGCVQWEAK